MGDKSAVERRFYDLKSGQISALHFGDKTRPIRLVFLHANGFNGLTYRRVFDGLSTHSVALDLRGHGYSTLPIPEGPLYNFHIFRDDVVEFIEGYVDDPVLIVGHSLGGAVAMLANQILPHHIGAALILDPPTLPASWRIIFRQPFIHRWFYEHFNLSKKARLRQAVFSDRGSLLAHYQKKSLFRRFSPGVLGDYIEGGTRPHDDGITLCCPPDWEARIFLGHDNDLFGAARALPKHSYYILADDKMASSPSARFRIRRIMGRDRIETAQGSHHLFPMEHPDYVRAHIERLLKASGIDG